MAVGEGMAETFEGFNVSLTTKGYPCIYVNRKLVYIHILVWERANGKIPPNFDIHHKDGNKLNYSLDNLELLSKSDHKRLHAGWVRENGQWTAKSCGKCKRILPLDKFVISKRRHVVSDRCKDCRHKDEHERRKAFSPEKKADFLKRRRESYKSKMEEKNV